MDYAHFSARHIPLIEARLDALLPAEHKQPCSLHRAMRYAALAGGKRLRPVITMCVAEAIGGRPEDALDAACAVELVHCFSLVHDDLPALDNDDLRRGMPTVHVAFDEATALLAGDALFALAFETLAGCAATPDLRAEGLRVLAAASGTRGMVGGQTVDVEAEGTSLNGDAVEWIHRRKTGALFEAAAALGAMFGGGDEAVVAAAGAYGAELGLAFQITDDILDETASERDLGKRPRADLERAKATFPAAVGLDGSRELARASAERAAHYAAKLPNPEGLAELARFAVERAS